MEWLQLVVTSFLLMFSSHLHSVHCQREWVQWGPLRVYVVGRGRDNLQQQLQDKRDVNSVQDILAQLDTATIENTTLPNLPVALPLISIEIPRMNESITLDCITSNNEPGQCKMVRDCFLNAFTTDGRIKNRALLEADVESSVSCNQTKFREDFDSPALPPVGGVSLGYDATPGYLPSKATDVRDKLICCEKPKALSFMKFVNISDTRSQKIAIVQNITDMSSLNLMTLTNLSNFTLANNITMLEMIKAALPTEIAAANISLQLIESPELQNITVEKLNETLNLNESLIELGEPLPNFEALIMPLMPEIMRLQEAETTPTALAKEFMETAAEMENPMLVMPDQEIFKTTQMPPYLLPESLLGEYPPIFTASSPQNYQNENITANNNISQIQSDTTAQPDSSIEEDHHHVKHINHTHKPSQEHGHEQVKHGKELNITQVIPDDFITGIHGHGGHHHNTNKTGTNSSTGPSAALIRERPPSKLCIVKPHLECAAKRVGEYQRPESVNLKNKYSWMATLFVDRQMFCMGSLIDAEHILTAAHCFPKNPSTMDFEKVKVGIGYHSERPNITSPFVNRRVSKIIIHEGFNFKTLLNDIAIVKLETPAFNKTSLFDYDDIADQDFPDPEPKPICFTEATEDINTSFENQEAILSGWTIPRRRRKTQAQEISIRVWNNEECCAKYGDIPPGGITDEMMCAFTYGKNDCFSRYNTGAPLFIISEKGKRVNAYNHSTPNYIVDRYDGDDEGDYVQFQVGILSWGYGCKDYPPVFTRVNPYFDWIEKNLQTQS